jgi:hypothetical protein
MAKPTSRQTLEDYCLRALGAPVIEVNIDEDQMSDRIDEAIQFYQEYHGDAVVRHLLKHKVTDSVFTLNTVAALSLGDTLVGDTSGTEAIITKIDGTKVHYLKPVVTNTEFSSSEVLSKKGASDNYTITALTKGDVENEFITIAESNRFLSINNIFNTNNTNVNSLFSVDYQIHLNDIFDLNAVHGGIVNYEMTKQYMSLIDRNINGVYELIEGSRHKNLVNFYSTTLEDVGVGNFIVFDGYTTINPETYTDVYNDMFLKKYTTALFKRQWGSNLIKFEGMTLPGGVTLNGRQIFDDAKEEIREMEEQMQLRHEMPPLDFVG